MDSRIPLYYTSILFIVHTYNRSRTGWIVHICKWIVGFHCIHPGDGTIGQTMCFFKVSL